MPDPIAETEQHAQELREQMFPGAPPSPLDSGQIIGNAIDARSRIDARREYLISSLPHANRRQSYAIKAELGALNQQERFNEWSANQDRIRAHTDAIETDKAIRRERDTRIDEMGADAMMRMHTLDNALHSGQITKEQFDDGMLELGQTHAEALHRHPEAARHWAEYLDQDNKNSQYQQRLDLREAAKLSTKYGVPLHVDPNSGQIDFESMRHAALGTPKGQAEALHALSGQMGLPAQAVFEHAEGGRATDPADPKTFTATDPNDTKNPQTHVRISMVAPTGITHQVMMPKQNFDTLKNQFQPAYNAIISARQADEPVPSPSTQPAASDPRFDLARRALSDPNASEAHKAAARQILGIQEPSQ